MNVAVLALVMIALSYVKMSSCPSVPICWAEIPLSGAQLTELSVEVKGRRWKVQADACGSYCSLSSSFHPFVSSSSLLSP